MAEHPAILRDPPLSQDNSPRYQESERPQKPQDLEASILTDPEHPTELFFQPFVKDELTRQLQNAKIRFEQDQELVETLSAKERELLSQFELKMDANNLSWEVKLKDCLENCRLEMTEKHNLEIEQIKVVHSEEMENALKANRIAHQAQMEALKELHQVEYDSTVQECEVLRKQLAEQMTSLEIDSKKSHQQEIEKMIADFEDSRKASYAEKQQEIELFQDRIKRLEEQLNKQVSTEDMAASYKQALQDKELEIQAYHQSQLALLKAVHSQTETTLRVDYESKITALESELESIEREVADNKSELEETHYQQILAIEAQQRDKVAAIQSHCERRLLEAQAIHAKEFENLQKEHLQKEDELLLAHEQNAEELLRSHQLEKDELIVQHQSEMSDLRTHSEPRPKALKVFSSPRPQSASDAHTSRSRPNMREEDLVDIVQSESTLFSPSKIQRIRDRFSQQREQALTERREKTPPPKSPQKRPESPSKLKAEYELKLTKLEEKMVTERKTQVDLLKKKHERDLADIEKKYGTERVELETKIRAQLEDEHFQHTEEAVAECLVDKDRGMDVTRQELELAHQKQISELQLSHKAELERINTEHCLKLETLTGECKEKSTSMELDTIQGQYSTELELQAAQYDTEIESLQMQIASLKSEQGLKMNELREQLKQDHMAKFKVMTNKLQQLHEGEVNALRQENVDLVSSQEHNIQMLKGELDSEREREIAAIVEAHKKEMKTIQERCEEQLAQQEVQDDQSDQLELNVRQELSRLNNDLETKLQQLETERQQYREREAALTKQLQQLETERQQYTEREAALNKQLQALVTETQQCKERETALTEQYRVRENALNKQLQALVTDRQQCKERETAQTEQYIEREAALNKQLQALVTETQQCKERETALTEQYRERENALNKQLQALVTDRQQYSEREAALNKQYTERESALTEQYREREAALTLQYTEREAALTEQLQTERQLRKAEDNETNGDKERLAAEIRTLHAERDLLRSTVTALYAAVSNCLELSTVVQSVLGHTHSDGLDGSHSNHGDIESRLSERLIAQQVVSPSDSDFSHSTVSSPIQPHPLHTPYGLAAPHSAATGGSASSKQSSDWTLMKLTPSVDSGIISQQASVLQSEASTLVGTPNNMTGTTPLSEGMSTLSIVPLDTTAPFTSHTHHSTSEDFDDTAHSFLSVSLMTPTGSPTHTVGGPDPISPRGHDHTQQSIYDQPLIDLSVLPLDSSTVFMTNSLSADHNDTISLDAIPNHLLPPSTDQSGAIPLDASSHHMEPANSGQVGFVLPDLSLLHSQLTMFHGSISNLVQQYATVVHVSQVEGKSGESQALVTQLQSQLDTMRQFHGQLQGQMEDSRRDGEGEVMHLRREVTETREQLDSALDKIKTLVQQLEGRDNRLEQELADERQEHRENLTAGESREEGLVEQLSASEKQLSERGRILEQLSAERTSLTDKVKEVCSTMEEKETALLQSSSEALQLRQENQALKQVNRQLRERQEQADFRQCSTEENLIEQKSIYESQLKQMQQELSELLDIRDRISAREEELENLLLEKEDLMNRLSIAEHQLATQAEQGRVEGQVGEKEQRLIAQLESQGELCETLRARLNETQSSHQVVQQQYVQSSTVRTQLQTELQQLRQELQRREGLATNTLAEKAALVGRVQSCQEELEAVKEELRMATEQRDHLETASESQASTMSGNLGVQDDASQEGEGLSVGGPGEVSAVEEEKRVSAQLESRVAALEQELRDKDQQQVVSELTDKLSLESRLRDSLQQEVAALRGDIERGQRSQEQVLAEVESKHEQEMQTIVTEHAQKLNELQLAHLEALHRQRAEVDAKHTGERAFIKLHHQEQLDDLQTRHREEIEQLSSEHHSLLLSLDNAGGTGDITDVGGHSLLLKIAELAPVLAREAQEVNDLCKRTGHRMSTVGVDQPDSIGQTSSLEALVERLREVVQDIGAAKDTSGVEDWRRDLLAAVGGLLEHQRGVLATTLTASALQGEEDGTEVQQMLQDQLSQHSALVQQLHSADRESLLAEIRALRATLESMRNEQRQQNRDLLAQLQANSQHPTDTTLLQQLQSTLAKLSLLEQELANTKQNLANKVTETGNKTHELEQTSRDIAKKDREFASKGQEFERVLRRVNEAEDSKRRAEEEVGVSRQKVVEMEGALSSAMSELGALKQELIVLREIETTLRGECSREKALSAQLRGSLLGEKTINQQLNDRLNERAKQEGGASQAMAVQLQAQLDEANEALEHLRQDKIAETDGLSGLEQELATLRSVLQAKEEQLTQTTDKLLQEKMLSSQANREVRAFKDRLATHQRELESYQERLAELSTLSEELATLQRDNRNLQSKLEVNEQDQIHLNGLRQEAELNHRQLVSSLQDQLRRSKLLRSTHSEQVTEGSGVRELMETLLQQEQLHLLSFDAVKADKEQLEREIRGLKKEVDDWKHLARTPVSSALGQPSSHTPRSTSDVAISEIGTNYEQSIEQANSKIARLYAQYRQAESHRKALVFQKRYLFCQVDAFYQTQQAALQMMADMGAPIEVSSFTAIRPKVIRPYIRFKIVAKVVLATLRFQYVRRRKIEYLRAKMSKVSASPSVATTYGFSPPQSTVGPRTSIKDQISSSRAYKPQLLPFSGQPPLKKTSTQAPTFVGSTTHGRSVQTEGIPIPNRSSKYRSSKNSEEIVTSSKHRRVLSHSKSTTDSQPTKMAKPNRQKTQSKRVNPLSLPGSGGGESSTSDPQLMAYIKGLEKLQARLSKTKL